ncbi:MAG: thioredoxin-dependent thiol peroxidase [Anaerolineales bacterium]|nr:thioredoxin-dependent thiol peroxidase [Anaerolineales bacterium]
MSLLKVGDIAPAFELLNEEKQTIRLSDFAGKKVVLFFYPRANTTGCTTEACGFRDNYSAFEDQDVVILGMSPDEVKDQKKFQEEHSFPYHLLADSDHAVAERYGVWGLKKMYGREYMGILRTTYVIDESGKITHVFENVKPLGHSEEVLAAL